MSYRATDTERIKSWALVAAMIGVVALIAWGLHYAVSPRRYPRGQAGVGDLPTGVGFRLKRSVFTGPDASGHKAWSLRADRVDVSIDRSRVEANGNVEAELFDTKTGKRRAFITAPVAVFTTATKTLQVGGKIECRIPGNRTPADLRLQADTLVWNVGAKQVICPGPVHGDLPSDSGSVEGRNLTLDLATREWSLSKFHGAFVLKEGTGSTPPPITEVFPQLPL